MATDVHRQLWGSETSKAIDNFQVSGEPVPTPVVHWLGRIKAAAARVNAELGLLDAELGERIGRAGDEVAEGRHDDQFPIDVFQTGSGTSSNTNANEVIASLAGEDVHPNDHVNMGQSSNDVFPSAVHLAAVGQVQTELLPALERLSGSLHAQVRAVGRRGQVGPHPHDGRRARDARARSSAATPPRSRSGAIGCATRSAARPRSRSAAPPPAPA